MTEMRVPHEVVGFLIQGVLCNIRQQTKKQTDVVLCMDFWLSSKFGTFQL